ncbi:Transducin/WD40 repeat-like superfamily protein [Prunus dulcis]|uniref:Transducin/WD40 repeat-like superfamily protein n=1 Tax=Prunus dulcis TaxID=3755 RepID=A0A4Y1R037_PRUDU|nr:Transducin/WD40 repeat-like superfamily protein [Prunus dulcis]
MDPVLLIAVLSILIGAVIALAFFGNYFRKRSSEIQSISQPELQSDPKKQPSKPHQTKKSHAKPHSHTSDKDQNKKHHPLDVNTLKGHGDAVTAFVSRRTGGVWQQLVRMECSGYSSWMMLRVKVSIAASQSLSGSSLYMYGVEKPKPSEEVKQQPKLPLPEIKWEHHKVHEKLGILTLSGTTASYGSADGSTIVASCSEGTDIILWHGKTGKILGHVDTNQLKNTMAALSPNGRFLAAAAFTADVKVWEIVYSKDGSVKESAVTWLCFTPNSEQIITASKDGSIRIWNINVRYHMDEDPKTLKVFPIPLDLGGATVQYDRLSLSPDGKILAATHGTTLQWLCVETGKLLDTADKAHEGDITCIAWAPKTIPMGDEKVLVLATSSIDKKVKLWAAPSLPAP